MAFPTLFPTGAADFLGQRYNQVTIGNYFTHLLKYDDGRFARYPRFRFIALNTEMRWRGLQAGRIYIQQHPGDAQLTVDELRACKLLLTCPGGNYITLSVFGYHLKHICCEQPVTRDNLLHVPPFTFTYNNQVINSISNLSHLHSTFV